MEASCGVALFIRTTREVRLTAEGERFLLHARRIIDDLNVAISELREQLTLKHGRIVIAATPSAAANILPGTISSFMKAFPNVQVEVVEEGAADVVHQVENGLVDFGIGPPPDRRSDLLFSLLRQENFVGVVGINHPVAKMKRIKLRGLLKYPFVTTVEGTNIRSTLEHIFRRERLDFNPVHKLVQLQAVVAMVAAGLGITMLPALTLPMLNLNNVIVVKVFDPIVWREIGVLRRRGGDPSAASNRFLRALAAC